MRSEDKYFQDLSQAELWQRYCGFLDLSIDDFMALQAELLIDQIGRVADSILGKKIMGNQIPASVEEFRRMVPLTTYDDYEPYLSERREDVLAIKPEMWCHSAGRGGHFKWIPYSSEFLNRFTRDGVALLILASSNKKGQVNISPGFRFVLLMPPPPYTSGSISQIMAQHLSFRQIPRPETSENMSFPDKIRQGFQEALKEGVDAIMAIASVLVRMGEDFTGQARRMKFSPSMLHPSILFRLLRALLRSKIEKRQILPKDLWPARAIMTTGLDTAIYKNDIAYYWGRQPYELYACTESFMIAMQSWSKKGMVFLPDLAFLEFIPCEEQLQGRNNKECQTSTVLLNQVQEGKSYEVVLTQLYGMPLLRYRMGDIVKVIALRDNETGVNLPHIVFQYRVGETINLAGLTQLDEKTVWQAIANTGIKYVDWIACKEYKRDQTLLRIYLELKEEKQDTEIATMIDEQLKTIDTDYKDIDVYLKLQPVRVTLLSLGTFQRYTEEKVREGANLAHLKPTHINPPQAVIKRILQLSKEK